MRKHGLETVVANGLCAEADARDPRGARGGGANAGQLPGDVARRRIVARVPYAQCGVPRPVVAVIRKQGCAPVLRDAVSCVPSPGMVHGDEPARRD